MAAATGWLQRNSSRFEEGRVLGPRIGWLQRTVAKWLSADSGTASAFQRMLGARRVLIKMLSGLSDTPTLTTRCRCHTSTEHRINIAHAVLHSIWNDEMSSEKGTIGEDARTGIGTPDILWSVNSVARAVTKWTRAYDRRLARLISYIHNTSDCRQNGHVGDRRSIVDWDCSKTQTLLDVLKIQNQPRGEFCSSLEVEHSFL